MKTLSTFTDAGWDFFGETTNGTEDIWDIHEGTDYPRFTWQMDDDLDGITDAVENGAPNGGDGNGDGIPDSDQSNVASLPNAVDGDYVSLVTPEPSILFEDVNAIDNPSPGDSPPYTEFPIGFFEFTVSNIPAGGSTTVTILLPPGQTVNTYYKYGPTTDNPSDHWYEFLWDGTTGAEIFSDRIILHFVDGQRGDDDLTANGQIVEPGAPAFIANEPPIANAGPDQTAYAWIDGIAEATLDGSDSNDPDGDALTYKWTWAVGANTYEANGVNPTIELPVGQYVISLIVNDGLIDSEPNEVNITVIGPIEANLNITPKVLNCKGFQPRITAMLRLPKGITKDQIDSNEPILLYPGQIEADKVWISRDFNYKCRAWSVTIFASFDKDELMDAIPNNGPVELAVVGRLKSGQFFFGSDNIRVICPSHRPRHKPWCDHRWDRRCRGPCNFRH
jgi:hypothetical protein